jgi:competence ComEA-like helix-hairpin-helix protein
LIGVALLLGGLLEMLPLDRKRSLPAEAPRFIYEDVEVVLPVVVVVRCVDVNADPVAELVRLNGIGEALAGRIVAYREEHGPFASLDDLTNVSGIGPATVDGFRDQACLGAPGQ